MSDKDNTSPGWSRRSLLKGLGGVPLLGAAWWAGKRFSDEVTGKRDEILNALDINAVPPPPTGPMAGDPVRVGIIGLGGRGSHLCRAMGFATGGWLEEAGNAAADNPSDTRLKDFQAQENLNVRLAGVCDVFDVHAEHGVESFDAPDNPCRRFRSYRDMIASQMDAFVEGYRMGRAARCLVGLDWGSIFARDLEELRAEWDVVEAGRFPELQQAA